MAGAVYKTPEDLTAAQALVLLEMHERAFHHPPATAPQQPLWAVLHQQPQQLHLKLDGGREACSEEMLEVWECRDSQ
jgi:hypothetical protein